MLDGTGCLQVSTDGNLSTVLHVFLYVPPTLYTGRPAGVLAAYVYLPSLSAEDREYLDSPITSDEISKQKIHGLNGVPIEWYLAHKEYVLPHLLFLYTYILEEKTLPASMREALIVKKSDNIGFIPGRSNYINLQKLFINLLIPNTSDFPRVLVALDTHKVFHSLE